MTRRYQVLLVLVLGASLALVLWVRSDRPAHLTTGDVGEVKPRNVQLRPLPAAQSSQAQVAPIEGDVRSGRAAEPNWLDEEARHWLIALPEFAIQHPPVFSQRDFIVLVVNKGYAVVQIETTIDPAALTLDVLSSDDNEALEAISASGERHPSVFATIEPRRETGISGVVEVKLDARSWVESEAHVVLRVRATGLEDRLARVGLVRPVYRARWCNVSDGYAFIKVFISRIDGLSDVLVVPEWTGRTQILRPSATVFSHDPPDDGSPALETGVTPVGVQHEVESLILMVGPIAVGADLVQLSRAEVEVRDRLGRSHIAWTSNP